MDTIDIVKFPPYASNETLQVLSYHLDRECNRITLKEINWPDTYPYRPDIHFRIAYNEQHIFLKFDVHENEFRATEITDCGHVWEDSCVELFIQLKDGDGYYNIEINAIGTILCAYGTGRENRSLMPIQISTTILRDSTIKFNNENQGEAFYQWSLIIRFPHTAFFKHTFIPTSGTTIKGNIHKCGNKLPHPHFVTWNPIPTEKPDFHRPDFFGTLMFK